MPENYFLILGDYFRYVWALIFQGEQFLWQEISEHRSDSYKRCLINGRKRVTIFGRTTLEDTNRSLGYYRNSRDGKCCIL